jgi:hypothetical protein
MPFLENGVVNTVGGAAIAPSHCRGYRVSERVSKTVVVEWCQTLETWKFKDKHP